MFSENYDSRTTVGGLVGAFADHHGIPRPTESELEDVVEKAAAETKNPGLKVTISLLQYVAYSNF